jgi:hypothetical protein
MRLLAAALLFSTLAAQPARQVWIRAKAPGAAQPDVHSVDITESEVVVRSAGISLAWLGPLGVSPQQSAAPRQHTFRIPLRPRPATGPHAHIPASHAGVFVNGVPIPNPFEAASYRGQNLWHFDTVAMNAKATHAAPRPGLLEELLPDRKRHSPLIGFALDGYPVYGPWTGGARMRSSYQLRKIQTRDRWPDGTRLAPGQAGPPVSAEYPLGACAEDYEYVPGSGDLDEYNGRMATTPEYPDGTYAYFLSTNNSGHPAFPYLLAHEFYGEYATPQMPGVLRFRVPGKDGKLVRHLEHVHEKPMHVLVISHDRQTFAHIHPEVNEQGIWEVPFTFPHAGRFRVYSDYTPPGGNQRVEHYDIDATGPEPHPAPPTANPGVTLENADKIRAGEDVELVFRVGDSIRGWQPYLGAWAHVVIAGEGLSSLLHAHPIDNAPPGEAHDHTRTPPPDRLRVAANFAARGQYKLWFQLQLGNDVVTIPFTLPVAAARSHVNQQPIPAGAARLRITAHGYEPMRLEIPPGKPVTLAITRTAEGNCGGRIVFPALGLSRDIPPGSTALLTLPAQPRGEVHFTCGMGMYRGSIVAVSAAPSPAPQKTRSASGNPTTRTP